MEMKFTHYFKPRDKLKFTRTRPNSFVKQIVEFDINFLEVRCVLIEEQLLFYDLQLIYFFKIESITLTKFVIIILPIVLYLLNNNIFQI